MENIIYLNNYEKEKIKIIYFDLTSKFPFKMKPKLFCSNQNYLNLILTSDKYKNIRFNRNPMYTKSDLPFSSQKDIIPIFPNDWVVITPVIEMILNLLFDSNIYSIKVLAYLRENEIKPELFLKFLYKYYGILLINSIDYNGKDVSDHVTNYLKSSNLLLHSILCLGNNSFDSKLKDVFLEYAKFIHPSSLNWRKRNYYDNWFNHTGFESSPNFNLSNFILIEH